MNILIQINRKLKRFKIIPCIAGLTLIIVLFLSFTYSAKQGSSQWVSLNPLPYKIEKHVALGWSTIDTNYLILAGGKKNDSATTGNVIRYNTTSQQYSTLPDLPEPLERAGGFILGSEIYIVGGANDSSNNFSSDVYKLDLTNIPGGWISLNNFPAPIGEITYSTQAINDTAAYVVGGRTGTSLSGLSYFYKRYEDSWNTCNPGTPDHFFSGGLAVADDSTLVYIGGNDLSSISSATFLGRIHTESTIPGIEYEKITWFPADQYPAGPVVNPGAWGAANGNVFFGGGGDTDGNQIYGVSYQFRLGPGLSGTYESLDVKPTPVTHSQLFGFVINPGPIVEYDILAPGGNDGMGSISTNEKLVVIDSSSVSITQIGYEIPRDFTLSQNYPNPFNPETRIRYSITRKTAVRLTVYNSAGKEISKLVNAVQTPGTYEAGFNAIGLPSGIYFYKLEVENREITRKMILLK